MAQDTNRNEFVMFEDKVVATKHGHAIRFLRGEPSHVPVACEAEVRAAGAMPKDAAEALKKQIAEDMKAPKGGR